jgi:uncharacterized protein
MDWYFLDTSALVKRYHDELGTAWVDNLFSNSSATVVVSRLSVVEVVSALALKVRTGELGHPDYVVARKKFLGEVKSRKLLVARLLAVHYREAERLIDRHAPLRRLRTLDAIQLAVAKDQQLHGRSDHFVTADIALLEVGQLEGLSGLNPMSV